MGAFGLRSEGLKGARFGAHEIVRLIGHGATASVFEARHVSLGKPVAIKLLHEHLGGDEQVAGRFVREGQLTAKLRHPNAIDVLDVGTQNGSPYLVMELLLGSDLRTTLNDVGVLPLETALAFLLPIASALAHAHDLGILHRDLKPANIFLARDVRDDVVPKLVDFGLSKGEAATDSLTATEMVAGTVLYMAPEQTLGVRHASPASDQYSLAAVLYECITGSPPFTSDSVYGLMERIRTDEPVAPSSLCPGLAPEVNGAILRALSRAPADRFPTVRAFARELLPFASEATVRSLERDFAERGSGGGRVASKPSVKAAVPRASPEAETRMEIPGESSSLRPLAPLPCPPGDSPFHVKGMAYRGFSVLVSKAVPGGMEAFCEALTDERLRPFARQSFLATGRYDVFPFVPLFSALARILATPLDTLVRTTTAMQARYDAKTVYKRIFDATRVEDVAQRIGRFNASYYDFGAFHGTVPAPQRLVSHSEGIPAYIAPWFGPMHAAYTLESMLLAGATEVVVVSQSTEPAGKREGHPLTTFRTELRWS